MKPVVTIGIAGGSASGKSSIGQKLQAGFTEKSFTVLKMDDYYKDQSDLTMDQRVTINYDHPFAFDVDLLVDHIRLLKSRQSIMKPTYDFVVHNRSSQVSRVEPVDVLIVEGLFTLEEAKLRELMDIKIFVDTPADVRFIRRLVRDMEERKRSVQSVVSQYMATVRVMHDLFVEPSKKYADIIIPEGGQNVVAIDLLHTKIASILSSNVI